MLVHQAVQINALVTHKTSQFMVLIKLVLKSSLVLILSMHVKETLVVLVEWLVKLLVLQKVTVLH